MNKRIKQAIIGFTILAVIFGIVDAGLWLTDHIELAIAVAAFVFALAVFAVGNVWTAIVMRWGADLTIRSQESDDERDIAQIKAATDLVKVLVRLTPSQSDLPALPMPDQQSSWLCDYEEGDYTEMN